MPRVVAIVLVLLAVLLAFGLALPVIYRVRDDAEFRRCQNHLRLIASIGMPYSAAPGQALPAKANDFFPAGTLMNPNLKPEQRLSWCVSIMGAIEQIPDEKANEPRKKTHRFSDLLAGLDVTKSWDAEANARAAHTRNVVLLCPAQNPAPSGELALTNYLGNGGIGLDTPTLSLEQAGKAAGVFRYDMPTPLAAINGGDGLSNSIAVVESTRDLGPWVQGGPATVRCLDSKEQPYLGPARFYSGCHRGRGNFAIADGSVRVLTDQTNPDIFRALLTIQGNETFEN